MSLEDELEPRLDAIRRNARQMHSYYLGAMGLHFDDGVIDWDPDNTFVGEPPDLEQERAKWRGISNDIDALCERFRSFYGLDPLDLTVLTGKLGGPPGRGRDTVVEESGTNVPAMLDNAWDPWVSRVDGMINEGLWEGTAALRFHESFLWRFEDAVDEQMAYAKILAAVSDVYHDTVARGLDDLRQIAGATAAALAGDRSGGDAGGFFTVAGLVVDIVGFIPVAGTAADIVGLALDIGSAYDDARSGSDDSRPISIDGGNVPLIIESAWNALTELDGYFADADETLNDRLQGYLDDSRCFASPSLEVERPDVADGTAAFAASKLPPAPATAGESLLVAELVRLYEAGYVNLPAAAERYEFAGDKLSSCTLPYKVTTFFPRSSPKFDTARNQLTRILLRTRDSLGDAGAAIVAAAYTYQLSDEENAVRLEQFRAMDPPPPPVQQTMMHHPL